MWIIFKQLDTEMFIVASENDSPNDELDIKLSLFRGPNRIIWYCRQPTSDINLNTGSVTPLYFSLWEEGKVLWRVKCVVEKVGWSAEKECVEITMVPYGHYMANFNMLSTNKKTSTIEEALTNIFPFDIYVGENLRKLTPFDGFNSYGPVIDYIAWLAHLYTSEFFIFDEYLAFGFVSAENVSVPNLGEYNNKTSFRISDTKEVVMLASDKITMYPGRYFNLDGYDYRIVYIHITVTRKETKGTTAPVYTQITYGTNEQITEQELAILLDPIDREILLSRFNNMLRTSAYFYEQRDGQYYVDTLSRKPNDISTSVLNVPINVKHSSPYAGENVGVQFPKQDEGKGLVLLDRNDLTTATVISQLWQNNEPKRNSDDDFRMTFPDGSSIYWENGNLYINMKGAIYITGFDNVSAQNVPTAGSNNYIKIENGKMYLDGTDDIPTMLHTHTFNHTHNVTALGAPTGPPIPLTDTNKANNQPGMSFVKMKGG